MRKEEIIQELKGQVLQFKEWLAENYSQEKIEQDLYDEAGYPNWNAVEDTFEMAFKKLDFADLEAGDLEAIGFLIARQWDVGIVFPYFKKEISFLGMNEKQLLILAEYAVNSKEWSLRQQCAASLWKAETNTEKAIEMALKFYQDKDDDIRRHSLNTLYKLNYQNIKELLEKSWRFNKELERMLCLEIWKDLDRMTFKTRLEELKEEEREYLKKYISDLKKIKELPR